MIKIFLYSVSRYCNALSYISAFLAGVAVVLPIVYMPIPLLGAVVLGSLSSYFKRRISDEDMRELAARLYAQLEESDSWS